jgi:hypothetical protein
MNNHQFIHFSLNLSYEQYAKVYQGIAKNVSVVADDGRRQGISGRFVLELTAENKLVSLQRLT